MEISFLLLLLWFAMGEFWTGARGAAIAGNKMIDEGKMKTAPETVVAQTTERSSDDSVQIGWGWEGDRSRNGIIPIVKVTGTTPSMSTPTPISPLHPALELRARVRARAQGANAILVPRATAPQPPQSPSSPTIGTTTETEDEVKGTTITPFPHPVLHASDDPALANQQKWHVETFWSCVTFDIMTHCGWHQPVVPGGDEIAGAGRVEIGFSWGTGRRAGKSEIGIGVGSLGVGVLGVAVVVAGLLV